jgi:hypothetical protein
MLHVSGAGMDAEHVAAAPVNVMAQFHPDNFCDPASTKYRDKYAEIARRPSSTELNNSAPCARIGPEVRDHDVRAPQSFGHARNVKTRSSSRLLITKSRSGNRLD